MDWPCGVITFSNQALWPSCQNIHTRRSALAECRTSRIKNSWGQRSRYCSGNALCLVSWFLQSKWAYWWRSWQTCGWVCSNAKRKALWPSRPRLCSIDGSLQRPHLRQNYHRDNNRNLLGCRPTRPAKGWHTTTGGVYEYRKRPKVGIPNARDGLRAGCYKRVGGVISPLSHDLKATEKMFISRKGRGLWAK